MAINTTVASPTLPPAHNGYGFYVDLYGIVEHRVLTDLGTPNAGGSTIGNYTFEILDAGDSTVDVSTYGLEISNGVLKATSANSDKAVISTTQTLTNYKIKITDNVAVDSFTSPAFSWTHSTAAPSVPALSDSRNWNDSLRSGVTLHQYVSAAEDCEGNQVYGGAPNSDTFGMDEAFHSLPIRRGGAFTGFKLSSASAQAWMFSNDFDASASLFEGCIPGLHITTGTRNYISSNPELFSANAAGDVWACFSMRDWRGQMPDVDLPVPANDIPYSLFFNMRFSAEDDAATTVYPQIQCQINSAASGSTFNIVGLSGWQSLDGSGGDDKSLFSSAVGAEPSVNWDETTDTNLVGANNNSAVYADVNGRDTFILVCFHKGVYTNPAGDDANKISLWMGNTEQAAPFLFFLPLHASNTGNTESGLRLNSFFVQNSNFYGQAIVGFDSSIWTEDAAYNAMVDFARSQHNTDKSLPASLVGGSTMALKTIKTPLVFGEFGPNNCSVSIGGTPVQNAKMPVVGGGWPFVVEEQAGSNTELVTITSYDEYQDGTGSPGRQITSRLLVDASRSDSIADDTTLDDPLPNSLVLTMTSPMNANQVTFGADMSSWSKDQPSNNYPEAETVSFSLTGQTTFPLAYLGPIQAYGRRQAASTSTNLVDDEKNTLDFNDASSPITTSSKLLIQITNDDIASCEVENITAVTDADNLAHAALTGSPAANAAYFVFDGRYLGVATGGGDDNVADSGQSWTDADFEADIDTGEMYIWNLTTGCMQAIGKTATAHASHAAGALYFDSAGNARVINAGYRSGAVDNTFAANDVYAILPMVTLKASYTDPSASSGGGFEILDTLNNDAAFNAIFAN